MNRLLSIALMAGFCVSPLLTASVHAEDPLPSWNDTAAKQAIIEFVTKVTTPDSPDFVPPADRIATFDNDGTLWCEAPVPLQAAFVFDELKRRAPEDPALAADPMVKAALDGDVAKLLAGKHHDGLMKVLALTHTGMTTDEFDESVRNWRTTYPTY